MLNKQLRSGHQTYCSVGLILICFLLEGTKGTHFQITWNYSTVDALESVGWKNKKEDFYSIMEDKRS